MEHTLDTTIRFTLFQEYNNSLQEQTFAARSRSCDEVLAINIEQGERRECPLTQIN